MVKIYFSALRHLNAITVYLHEDKASLIIDLGGEILKNYFKTFK